MVLSIERAIIHDIARTKRGEHRASDAKRRKDTKKRGEHRASDAKRRGSCGADRPTPEGI